jgi:hypothetical protein
MNLWSGNASTPTEPTGRCFVCFRHFGPKRETIKMSALGVKRTTGVFTQRRKGGSNGSGAPLRLARNNFYKTHLIKYHTPNPTAPITPRITSASNVINNLNFRYRFLSGGASELCGKYGGGV